MTPNPFFLSACTPVSLPGLLKHRRGGCEQGRSHMQYSIKTHRQLLAQGAKDDKKSLERAGILDYRDCWNGARHRLFIRSHFLHEQ